MIATSHRSHLVRTIAIGSFATELLLSGCSKPVDRSEHVRAVPNGPIAPAPRSIFPEDSLPVAYVGRLDTRDGRLELWTLWLKPGLYFLRVEYRERAGSSSEDVIGTWEPIADRAAIRLRSTGRRAIELEVPSLDTLQFRGIIVRHPTDPPPYLVRDASIRYLEPRVNLTGYMSCVDDAGYFQDCGTAWSLPILPEGDFKSALRKYLDVTPSRSLRALPRPVSGSPGTGRPTSLVDTASESVSMPQLASPPPRLLVSLDVRIVQRPGVDGGPRREWLFIERFVRAMSGKSCDDSSAVAERERRELVTHMPYGLR